MVVRRRRAGRRVLSLWANGERVGVWRIDRLGHVLEYDAGWATSQNGRPLSLSLPLQPGALTVRTPAVERYFDNLLPDSEVIRRRIRERYATPRDDAFDLLAAVGRDCVGALQLLPEDDTPAPPGPPTGTPLTDDEVATELAAVTSTARLGARDEDEFRISIAGAQEKTALLLLNGRWTRPTGSNPTTHIFKLPLGRVGVMEADLSTSIENEWLCLRLLKTFGLPVAHAEIGVFAGKKALVVERFDRLWEGPHAPLLRLMQEDFCQALGFPSSQKYENHGGPGMEAICGRLLQSERRDEDLETFWQAQVLFAMLAAPDGHAKNFSVRLLAGGAFQLTPLYDVLSAWPVIGRGPHHIQWKNAKLAMAFRGHNVHYHLHGLLARHILATAERECRIARARAQALLHALVERAPNVIDIVAAQLPAGFPEHVSEPIFRGLRESAERFGRETAV